MRQLCAAMGVLVVLLVIIGVLIEWDKSNTPDKILAAEVEECFANDNYIEGVKANMATNGRLTSEDEAKLAKIRANYYVNCINSITERK